MDRWNRKLGTSKREQGFITPKDPNKIEKGKRNLAKEMLRQADIQMKKLKYKQ